MANFIPARITGIFIILASMILGYNGKEAWRIFFRDRKNHSSPNSAHSEASVAGALGVQFGGRVSYFGKEVDKPTIGDKKKEFEIEDIKKKYKNNVCCKFFESGSVFGNICGDLFLTFRKIKLGNIPTLQAEFE